MKSHRPTLIPAAVVIAALSGSASAQSIDMTQVRSATLSADTQAAVEETRQTTVVPHARQHQWTRISMTTDALGHPRAVCSVEKAPWAMTKVPPIHTNQPSRK